MMASTCRALNVCLLALALLAAQTVLIVHDTAPHGSTHTTGCQLCAHAAGAGHALPAPPLSAVHVADSLSQPPSVFNSHTVSTRIHSHHARAPPIELA